MYQMEMFLECLRHLTWGGGKLFSKLDDDDVQPRRMYNYVASNFRFRKKFDVESDFGSRPPLVWNLRNYFFHTLTESKPVNDFCVDFVSLVDNDEMSDRDVLTPGEVVGMVIGLIIAVALLLLVVWTVTGKKNIFRCCSQSSQPRDRLDNSGEE